MSPGASLWAHVQSGLLLAALLGLAAPVGRWPPRVRHGAILVALGLAWLPLGALDLTGHLHAYTGALSLTSLGLLVHYLGRRWYRQELFQEGERTRLGWLLAGTALVLYPLALGLGSWDPYALGFNGPGLALLLGLLAALMQWRGQSRLAWLLLAVLWAWGLGLGPSDNLWDYLLDAWLGLGALTWALIRGGRWLWGRI